MTDKQLAILIRAWTDRLKQIDGLLDAARLLPDSWPDGEGQRKDGVDAAFRLWRLIEDLNEHARLLEGGERG